MRTLRILLQKEVRQIFRNKIILRIATIMPIMQFIILPLAANFEIKNINLVIVDHDHSVDSRKLLSDLTSSGYFRLIAYDNTFAEAYKSIETDKADVILEIPAGFERNLVREGSQEIYIAFNAINGTKAGLGAGYLRTIIARYNKDLILKFAPSVNSPEAAGINVVPLNWFNSKGYYKLSLIPGILGMLVTILSGFLTALNIVKEKEVGTIEQINVSPIRKRDFILAKLIPFWVLANLVFTIGLILSYFLYGIVSQGNLLVLYAFVAVYLLAILGFGLLVSTYSETQQQSMFIMFFFIMIFILLAGLFTPIESMPHWAQLITRLNPLAYLITVIRMVMLKGSGFKDILPQLETVALMAVVLNVWAVLNYKKKV
ncbi:MAG: ABC transporter permease [Ginsengibacter sp.]